MEQQAPTPPQSTPQPPELPHQPPPPLPEPSPPTPSTTTTTDSSAPLPPPTTAIATPSPLSSTTTTTPPLPSLPSASQNPPPSTSTPAPVPVPAPASTATAVATATPTPTSQARPIAAFNRPWQQPPQPTHFSHFSLPPPPLPLPPHSSSSSTINTTTPASTSSSPSLPRGGMAIGVPAHHPGTPSFSSITPPSYGQPFGGLGRNVADSAPTSSSSSQVRPNVGGMQGIGMMGKLGSSSAMRPPGVPVKPVQSSPRPQSSPSTQSSATQNFQGHGMLRISSAASPGSPSPGSSQSQQPQNQPWLNSGSQMKSPLQSSRPQVSPQSMQQRSHIPQQHHHATTATSQQQASSVQQSQQPSTSGTGPQEHYGQQFPQSRIQHSLPNQQQIARNPSVGTQRPSHSTISSSPVQPALPNRAPSAEPEEHCNRILSKRSIQELVTQVDPSEKLDPEVEDILVDIAEDFIESITTFGCSLAKHRKSTTLEAKDILLHLERNWNMNLPGFSGDEIKTYRKPFVSDIHRERLAVVKKSILAGETINSRTSAGQAGGHPKGHLAKGPASIVGSPTTKVREAA